MLTSQQELIMTIVNQVLPKNSTEIALSPKQKLFFSRFATNKMMDAMLWVNSVAKIIWVNNAACSLTEYFHEELLSMTIYDLDLNFVELPCSKYQSDVPGKEFLVLESLVRTKNNRKFPVKLKIASVNYDGQKYNCVLLQNTAEQKNAFDLEHKVQVQQPKVELTNTYGQLQAELAKVRQKLNQKEQLDRQNTQLVSLVSHELRGPLNIISFANSLLQRYDAELSESKKRVHLNQIQAGVQQLNQLIDTMILIGKAKANKLNFQPQKIDLQQFCVDLVAQLQSCQEDQPEINFITTGNHREIAVDPQLLQSILRNLLDNASKYSANSPIDLILEYKSRELIFQVKDRGVGIAKEDVPQLFEPFTRGKDCHHIKGSGLGLAIVKQLVEIHRGQIQVFSQLGLGTTIKISLPLN
jgi:signal transduction histidine kinase